MLANVILTLTSAAIVNMASASTILNVQPRGSSGCDEPWDFAGETRLFTLQSGGREREYHVHLPVDYDQTQKAPLYIAYHGSEVEPLIFEESTQFSNPDVNPGAITVYPRGVDLHWEGPTYANPDVSDLQFTSDLVQRLKEDFCVDTARIYATGHSNGGGFVNTLACDAEHGAQFAAFAGVASALYTDVVGNENCNPARSPLPVFEAHGTADITIPYEGGEGSGGPLPAVPEWLDRWVERNDCGARDDMDLPNNVVDQSWSCGGVKGLLRHVKMEGKDHSYPSVGDESIFISPVIVEFFNAHRHPNPP